MTNIYSSTTDAVLFSHDGSTVIEAVYAAIASGAVIHRVTKKGRL